ncbi:hypothetical protein KEM52_001131 [Ascosphaera acerosa]|nr:hypothetical protein KEM52_001131 [Ascosphaera acerosa]
MPVNVTTINPAQLFFDAPAQNGLPASASTTEQIGRPLEVPMSHNGQPSFQAQSAPPTSMFAAMLQQQQQQQQQQQLQQQQQQQQQQFQQHHQHSHQGQQQQEQQDQQLLPRDQSYHQPDELSLNLLKFESMAIDNTSDGQSGAFDQYISAGLASDGSTRADGSYAMLIGPGSLSQSAGDGSSPSAFSSAFSAGSQSGVSGMSDSILDGTHAGSGVNGTMTLSKHDSESATNGWCQETSNNVFHPDELSLYALNITNPLDSPGFQNATNQDQQQQSAQQQQQQQQTLPLSAAANTTAPPMALSQTSGVNQSLLYSHQFASMGDLSYTPLGNQSHDRIVSGDLSPEGFLASPPISASDSATPMGQSLLPSDMLQPRGNHMNQPEACNVSMV